MRQSDQGYEPASARQLRGRLSSTTKPPGVTSSGRPTWPGPGLPRAIRITPPAAPPLVLIPASATPQTPALRRDLRRRSAIEPAIGHMKTDGRLARCAPKGTLGDALHDILCGCGHNIRTILAHLRALVAVILAALTATIANIIEEAAPNDTKNGVAA